jgi:hypothetical protein
MSFKYTKHNNGPKTDPWGTPADVELHKHLGVIFSNDCKWTKHIDKLIEKSSKQINVLRKLKFKLKRNYLEKHLNVYAIQHLLSLRWEDKLVVFQLNWRWEDRLVVFQLNSLQTCIRIGDTGVSL